MRFNLRYCSVKDLSSGFVVKTVSPIKRKMSGLFWKIVFHKGWGMSWLAVAPKATVLMVAPKSIPRG
jgi:hypothetical protein